MLPMFRPRPLLGRALLRNPRNRAEAEVDAEEARVEREARERRDARVEAIDAREDRVMRLGGLSPDDHGHWFTDRRNRLVYTSVLAGGGSTMLSLSYLPWLL